MTLVKHPWSIGGGGAAELVQLIEDYCKNKLEQLIEAISSICLTRQDEAYLIPKATLVRQRIALKFQIISVQGEHVRDWCLMNPGDALFPYDHDLRAYPKILIQIQMINRSPLH